jgi:hypothetical protein
MWRKGHSIGEVVMVPAEWQSVVIGLALLLLIGAIAVSAIRKYPVDDALKVVGALAGLLGVVTGAFTTYFFTRQPLIEARQQVALYKTALQTDLVAANSAAKSANEAAAGAQSTANQALSTAQSNSTAIEAVSEKIDRMFKKSVSQPVESPTRTPSLLAKNDIARQPNSK